MSKILNYCFIYQKLYIKFDNNIDYTNLCENFTNRRDRILVTKNVRKVVSTVTALILTCSILSISKKAVASVSSDRYNSGVSIGFTSMGDIDTLEFTVTDNYMLKEQNIICKSGANYKIVLAASSFTIYENGNVVGTTSNDITLTPLNQGSFVMFKKEGYTRRFSGSITFKKTDADSFIPINSLDIENYVKGVLPFEESNDFPIEALKAQAVAARTYCIMNKGKYSSEGYDLTDDISSQVYRGYVPYYANCNSAVELTAGEILTFNGQAINAYFSSSNGGYTEQNDNVWSGSQLSYLIESQDPYDTANRNWAQALSSPDIDSLLKTRHPELNVKQFLNIDIANIKKYTSGRISSLKLIYVDNNNSQQEYTLTKSEARTFFGLKSSLYTVTLSKDSSNTDVFTFTGSGYGHGIGMSQWGAYGRALSGQDYKTILAFYYDNTSVESLGITGGNIRLASRIGGSDRYETSALIAGKTYDGMVNNVVIASGNNFPDALAGSVLAKRLDSPLLIVDSNPELSTKSINYIIDHLLKDGHIYILGGEGTISSEFIEKFKKLGYNASNIVRIGGKDRYETASLIASNVSNVEGTPLVICTGDNFPDSLSVSSVAASKGWPILLVSGDSISTPVQNYITRYKPSKVYIIGGTGAVSKDIEASIVNLVGGDPKSVIRYGGNNRYETSVIVNNAFLDNPSNVTIASGLNFPDALSGSVYAANNNAPMLLVDNNAVKSAQNYLELLSRDVSNVSLTVFGLQGAVSDSVVNDLTGGK
jgi:stage II sporulation protein D